MNNLLPKSVDQFSENTYWEHFFKTRSNSFEWYGEYASLKDLFVKYVKPKDNVLVIGCGNSTLSEDLYVTHKCSNVVSIDTSATAIDQMLTKNKELVCPIHNKREKIFDFICSDASNLSSYQSINEAMPLSCIIDKGTTDAIHSGGSSSCETLNSMWLAIETSLSFMGRYILITLAQEHILDSIVEFFMKENKHHGWMINVHELTQSNDSLDSFKLPIFAFVFYKMKHHPSLPLVYIEENSFTEIAGKSQKTQLNLPKIALNKWVLTRQRLSMLCNNIQKSGRTESVIYMVSSQSCVTRYHCVLVHNRTKMKKDISKLIYCVFIVPFGQHNSPVYEGERSRMALCRENMHCQLCLFVYLNPKEHYASKQLIQDELNSLTLKFCPKEAPGNYSIPVMTSSEQVCSSRVSTMGSILLETVETYTGLSSLRLVSPSLPQPILMATVALSPRDRVIERWIPLLPVGDSSLYYGRPCCTDSLNEWWTVSTPECTDEALLFCGNRFAVSLNVDLGNMGPQVAIVCESQRADCDVVSVIFRLLAAGGVMVLCSPDNVLANDLTPEVRLRCEVSDKFADDRTFFWVLSRTELDVSPFYIAFKKIQDEQ